MDILRSWGSYVREHWENKYEKMGIGGNGGGVTAELNALDNLLDNLKKIKPGEKTKDLLILYSKVSQEIKELEKPSKDKPDSMLLHKLREAQIAAQNLIKGPQATATSNKSAATTKTPEAKTAPKVTHSSSQRKSTLEIGAHRPSENISRGPKR